MNMLRKVKWWLMNVCTRLLGDV